MENKSRKSISWKFTVAKIIAVIFGGIYSLVILYRMLNPLPYSHKTLAELNIIEWILGIFVITAGPASIIAGFLNHKFPIPSARMLIISGGGIGGLLFAIMIGLLGFPILIAGLLTLSAENDMFKAARWPKQPQTLKKPNKTR